MNLHGQEQIVSSTSKCKWCDTMLISILVFLLEDQQTCLNFLEFFYFLLQICRVETSQNKSSFCVQNNCHQCHFYSRNQYHGTRCAKKTQPVNKETGEYLCSGFIRWNSAARQFRCDTDCATWCYT